jgi:CRISP-associated protein Cas1
VKRLLNTLYITSEGASLRKEGDTVIVELEGKPKTQVPLHLLGAIIVHGAILLTPTLIETCAERGITLSLFDRIGRFKARIEGPVSGNVLLRREQYRQAETGTARGLEIVRSMLMGKIVNQRSLLQRGLRDHGDRMAAQEQTDLSAAVAHLGALLRGPIRTAQSVDVLRGLEGDAASRYFAVFGRLVRSPDSEIQFNGRSRRPPLDPVNAVLSFLYALLTHDCRSALEGVGLDPAVGFLHRDRPGRPSLALDLMEELRPALADRVTLSLFNRRQLRASDFRTENNGAVSLTDDGRRTVITAWQDRKRDERRHAFLAEIAAIGLVPHLQALLLARHLRGDVDGYPPWFWS